MEDTKDIEPPAAGRRLDRLVGRAVYEIVCCSLCSGKRLGVADCSEYERQFCPTLSSNNASID